MTKKSGDLEISLAAPDANLYLSIFSLLTTQPSVENPETLKIATSYSDALQTFESVMKEAPESQEEVYKYYHSLFRHELNEHDDYFSDWESQRIY